MLRFPSMQVPRDLPCTDRSTGRLPIGRGADKPQQSAIRFSHGCISADGMVTVKRAG